MPMPKYYLYVSDTKVDMLYEQIPSNLRDNLAAELEINLGVLKTKLSEEARQKTRYLKLDVIRGFLKKEGTVGKVVDSKPYFSGIASLKWGPVILRNIKLATDENPWIVCFAGDVSGRHLRLTGSWKHVIGVEETSPVEFGGSYSWTLFSPLIDEIETGYNVISSSEIHRDIKTAFTYDPYSIVKYLRGPSQRVEFLARRFYEDDYWGDIYGSSEGPSGITRKPLLVGSPIFVALRQ